jgi:hypothetical protein
MCRNECAKLFSRSHDAVSRVSDESGNVIKMHEHAARGRFLGAVSASLLWRAGPGYKKGVSSHPHAERVSVTLFINAFTDCSTQFAAQAYRQLLPRRGNPRFSFSTFGHVLT